MLSIITQGNGLAEGWRQASYGSVVWGRACRRRRCRPRSPALTTYDERLPHPLPPSFLLQVPGVHLQ